MLSGKCIRVLLGAAGLLLAAATLAPHPVRAQFQPQGVRGVASVDHDRRLCPHRHPHLPPVESQVRLTSGILVIQFRQPVLCRSTVSARRPSEYIGAARRDPDGRALRFAMKQR